MCLDLGTAVVGAKASAGSEIKIYSNGVQEEMCCDVSDICKLDATEKVWFVHMRPEVCGPLAETIVAMGKFVVRKF